MYAAEAKTSPRHGSPIPAKSLGTVGTSSSHDHGSCSKESYITASEAKIAAAAMPDVTTSASAAAAAKEWQTSLSLVSPSLSPVSSSTQSGVQALDSLPSAMRQALPHHLPRMSRDGLTPGVGLGSKLGDIRSSLGGEVSNCICCHMQCLDDIYYTLMACIGDARTMGPQG